MLELHNRVKNTIQNLNDLNLIATLSEGDMKTIDFIIPRQKKINRTHCDEPVDEQIIKGTIVFSFRNTASAKFEVSTLTNLAPEFIITVLLFHIPLLSFFLTYNPFARIS